MLTALVIDDLQRDAVPGGDRGDATVMPAERPAP